tara:strand:- start:231 stop:404 length:174 start_codon:yes stop_codon:yes gene_type:complete
MKDKDILNSVLTSLKECLTINWNNENPEVVIKDIVNYIEEKKSKQKKKKLDSISDMP